MERAQLETTISCKALDWVANYEKESSLVLHPGEPLPITGDNAKSNGQGFLPLIKGRN